MRWLTAASILSLLVWSTPAAAQTCRGNAAFAAVRQGRRALEGVRSTNADVDRDLLRLKVANALAPRIPDRWHYGALTLDGAGYGSLPTCTGSGVVGQGGILGVRGGGVVGYDAGDLGLRLHWVMTSDELAVDDPETGATTFSETHPSVTHPTPASLTLVQQVFGGSVSAGRWARLHASHVTVERPQLAPSVPTGLRLDPAGAVGGRHLSFGVDLPVLAVTTDALTNVGTGEIDLARVTSSRLPLGDTGLLGTIGTSYIADERQVTQLVGLTYQHWSRAYGRPVIKEDDRRTYREGTGHEIGAEASGESRGGRLRHARARYETFAVSSSSWRTHGPTYLRAGVFAEATYFGGAWFRQRTGRENVFGGGAGVHGGFGIRWVSMNAEIYAGANRPELLARAPSLATSAEARGQLYVRAGW